MSKNDKQQQEWKKRSKPSELDGQLHGGMMEDVDQLGNIVAGTVDNLTGNDEDPPKK